MVSKGVGDDGDVGGDDDDEEEDEDYDHVFDEDVNDEGSHLMATTICGEDVPLMRTLRYY